MKTIRVKVDREFIYDGRKVLEVICEPNEQDRKERAKRLIESHQDRRKAVIRKSASGGLKFYASVTEAAKDNNISYSSISKCCNGKQAHAGAYSWEFEKD